MQILLVPIVRRTHRHVIYIAHEHDEWPLFRIWFSVMTVIASIVLNMGVFAVLVALHMALDVIKYRTKHSLPWYWVGVETLRESLLDLFFIALGLLLAIAFHHAVAVAGVGKPAELGILFLSLLLRWGPRIKIAEHLLEIVLYWKHHFEVQSTVPHMPLTKSEKATLFATIIILIGILVTPFTTPLTYKHIGDTMQHELTPRLEFNITKTLQEL